MRDQRNQPDGGRPGISLVAGDHHADPGSEAMKDVLDRLEFWIPQLPDGPERTAFMAARRGLAAALGQGLLEALDGQH
jgi:hypothetical protein